MESTFRATRRVTLVTIGALSALGALVAAWKLVVPEAIGSVQTLTLITLLALVVMPGLTLAAWILERRHADRSRPAPSEGRRNDTVLHIPSPDHGERTHRHVRPTRDIDQPREIEPARAG